MEPGCPERRRAPMGSVLATLKDVLRSLRRAFSLERPHLVRVPIVDRTPPAWGRFRRPSSLAILSVPNELFRYAADPFTLAAQRSRARALRSRADSRS